VADAMIKALHLLSLANAEPWMNRPFCP